MIDARHLTSQDAKASTDQQAFQRELIRLARGEIVADEATERLIAKIYKRARKERRRRSESERIEEDRTLVAQTGRVRLESGNVAGQSPDSTPLESFSALKARSRRCYICRDAYRDVHHFYHLLCPRCATINERRREAAVDLRGRRAFVTGGRIKIGHQTAFKLLRWGSHVTVTTRFPTDAAARFSAEPDRRDWEERLRILQADFRDVPSLLRLVRDECATQPALDILINNAAQSVRPPTEFFQRMQQIEEGRIKPANLIAPDVVDSAGPTNATQILDESGAPCWLSNLNRHGELVDRRESNSWTQRLGDVEPLELLEVLLINSNAPCLLTSGLKPLFLNSSFPDRYVINVTGLDGQFGRSKTSRHPHVNMSKAALNMLTRTSAADYATDGIHMNSVDTGWITHEGAWSKRTRMRARGFVPPLDEVDGAARILAPIADAIQGDRQFGKLFRHYEPAAW